MDDEKSKRRRARERRSRGGQGPVTYPLHTESGKPQSVAPGKQKNPPSQLHKPPAKIPRRDLNPQIRPREKSDRIGPMKQKSRAKETPDPLTHLKWPQEEKDQYLLDHTRVDECPYGAVPPDLENHLVCHGGQTQVNIDLPQCTNFKKCTIYRDLELEQWPEAEVESVDERSEPLRDRSTPLRNDTGKVQDGSLKEGGGFSKTQNAETEPETKETGAVGNEGEISGEILPATTDEPPLEVAELEEKEAEAGLEHLPTIYDEEGEPSKKKKGKGPEFFICGAITPARGDETEARICRHVVPQFGERCRLHCWGVQKSATDGRFKEGLYSKFAPAIAKHYFNNLDDEELGHLDNELRAIKVSITKAMELIDTHPNPLEVSKAISQMANRVANVQEKKYKILENIKGMVTIQVANGWIRRIMEVSFEYIPKTKQAGFTEKVKEELGL